MATSPNLLLNPGFERGAAAWTPAPGEADLIVNVGTYDFGRPLGPLDPHSGTRLLVGSARQATRDIRQDVALTGAVLAGVARDGATVTVAAQMAIWSAGNDPWVVGVECMDRDDVVLATISTGEQAPAARSWTEVSATGAVPAATTSLRVRLRGRRAIGSVWVDGYFDDIDLRVTYSDPPPTPGPTPEAQSDAYRRAVRALYPAVQIVQCAVIATPSETVRLVKGHEARALGGADYVPAAFRLRVDAAGDRAPTALLEVGHVGRELSDWIAAAGGGVDATVRFEEWVDGAAMADWVRTFRVAAITETATLVSVRLGLVPVLGQPAVHVRYDPETFPALFG